MIHNVRETVIFQRSDAVLANFVGAHPKGVIIFQSNNYVKSDHYTTSKHFLESIFYWWKAVLKKLF